MNHLKIIQTIPLSLFPKKVFYLNMAMWILLVGSEYIPIVLAMIIQAIITPIFMLCEKILSIRIERMEFSALNINILIPQCLI